MYHFVKKLSFPPLPTDSNILCGIKKNTEIRVTNNEFLVDCPQCKYILNKDRCDICGSSNLVDMQPNHFNRVCEEHSEYATYFQLEMVKVKLGYQTHLPPFQCAICKELLTKEESESVEKNHFNITCFKHRDYANKYDLGQEKI